jgi:hypothetical protein
MMTPDGYTGMELFRLSPNTGEALTRLNVLEGQVLHGRVYKMDSYGGGRAGGAAEGSADTGGIAKIALGSMLIEAVLSKSISEGSHIQLEVVKASGENFILKLLAIDGTQVSGSNSMPNARRSDVAEFTARPFEQSVADTQSKSLNALLNEGVTAKAQVATRSSLVNLPDPANLPKQVIQLIKAAVNEGFIKPEGFTTSSSAIRGTLGQSLAELGTTVSQLSQNAPTAAREIIQSLDSMVQTLRPLVQSLPAGDVVIGDSSAKVAGALTDYTSSLKSINLPAQADAQTNVTGTQTQQGQPAGTASGGQTTSPGTPQSGTEPVQVPGQITQPGIPIADIASQGLPLPPLAPLPAGISQSQAATGQPAVEIIKSEGTTGQEAEVMRGDSPTHATRNILLGMRVLGMLAERMSRTPGLRIEDSSVFSSHASRISNLSNALEGAMLAPLITQAYESPDMIPRLLISLLFPGGHGEFAVLQPRRDGSDGGADAGRDEGDNEQVRTTGVIRITTPALRELGVRLDYREVEDEKFVSGIFSARGDAASEIRASLPELETALDARGITIADGFIVRELAEPAVDDRNGDDGEGINTHDSQGGLDIRV